MSLLITTIYYTIYIIYIYNLLITLLYICYIIFICYLLYYTVYICLGLPCGSAGKESARNAEDLALIPGLGRSPGEGKGYPLQATQASILAWRILWTV